MPQYLYLEQDGEGCDYTIGCGSKLIELPKGSSTSQILQDYSGTDLKRCMILEFKEDLLPIFEIMRTENKNVEEKEEIESKIRNLQQQLSRLK